MAVKAKKAVKKTAGKAVKKPAKKPGKKVLKKPVKKAVQKKVQVTKKAAKSIAVNKSPSVARPAIPSTVDPNAPGMSRTSCDVVEMGGNSFVVVVNRARNFFTLDEMKVLVRICHAAGNESAGAERLYKWFKTYRSDVLKDTDIEYSTDTALVSVYRYLVNHYSVKE